MKLTLVSKLMMVGFLVIVAGVISPVFADEVTANTSAVSVDPVSGEPKLRVQDKEQAGVKDDMSLDETSNEAAITTPAPEDAAAADTTDEMDNTRSETESDEITPDTATGDDDY